MPFQLFPRLRELGMPQPIGVVQVGASIGQEMKEFVDGGIRAGVFIEPLPEPFAHLSRICEPIPNFIPIQALCAETTGKIYELRIASNGGQSSSILQPKNHLQLYPNINFKESVPISSITLDDVLKTTRENGFQHVVDASKLLYMDCQGAEFQILRGASASLSNFDFIYTEVMRNELYQGQIHFLDYCHFLDAIGFALNDVYFQHPEQGGNALFIKKHLLTVGT